MSTAYTYLDKHMLLPDRGNYPVWHECYFQQSGKIKLQNQEKGTEDQRTTDFTEAKGSLNSDMHSEIPFKQQQETAESVRQQEAQTTVMLHQHH